MPEMLFHHAPDMKRGCVEGDVQIFWMDLHPIDSIIICFKGEPIDDLLNFFNAREHVPQTAPHILGFLVLLIRKFPHRYAQFP